MPDIPQGFPQFGGDTGNQQQQQQGQGSDSLADNFLSSVSDEDKEVVGKYIKEWDAGVTRKFQEIHGSYAPYKDLGDIESLQQAIAVAQMLENDPEHIYNALAEMLEKNVQPNTQGQQQGNGNQNGLGNLGLPGQQQVPPELNAYLTPVQEQMAQQQKMLEQLAQIVVTTNNQSREQQEDAALDSWLAGLHEKHGQFDDNAVLFKVMNGMDGDQAVEGWKNDILQSAKELGLTTYQGPTPPPSLSGGSVPDNGTSVTEMDSKSTKELVANIMQMASQQGK